MSDLKEFLQDLRPKFICDNYDNRLFNSIQEELGLFYWNREGKRFVKYIKFELADSDEFDDFVYDAEQMIAPDYPGDNVALQARDFLDCVDCLGEEKVKELIKKEGVSE